MMKEKSMLATMKKVITGSMIALVLSTIGPNVMPAIPTSYTVEAATKISLNKTKISLNVGKKIQLKMQGTRKKVKWSSSNKAMATVNASGLVIAKKAGKVTIVAEVEGKKYKCVVTIVAPQKTVKGSVTKNNIRYDVSYNPAGNGMLTVKITNKSGNRISCGWTAPFCITLNTSKGSYTVNENRLQSLWNSGNVLYSKLSPNQSTVYTMPGKINGTLKSITISNIFPLSSMDCPMWNMNNFNYIVYCATVLLK